jgi:hypothetical protein
MNCSLSAINMAKVEQQPGQQPFSMANVKTLYHNQLLLDRFFSILPEGAFIGMIVKIALTNGGKVAK